MKKYVFLFLFTIIWAISSPYVAIFASKAFMKEKQDISTEADTSQPINEAFAELSKEEVTSQNNIYESTENTFQESQSDDVAEQTTYIFTPTTFLEIAKDICPQILIDEETSIKINADENGICLSVNVGNSAFTASALANQLSLSTCYFVLEKTDQYYMLKTK